MGGQLSDLLGYLADLPEAALAFSGGTDSSFLLWACGQAGLDVRPFFVRGHFQTEEESRHALQSASSLGMDLRIIDVDTMSFEDVVENTPDRCYLCKMRVFSLIKSISGSEGYGQVIDATNASDGPSSRPGMRALKELGIISPLRECGLTKPAIRELSRRAGLDNWNVPSNSCLATRVPTGTRITAEDLRRIEKTEEKLRPFGLKDFRVRSLGGTARLEVVPSEEHFLMENRSAIEAAILEEYGQVEYGLRKAGLRSLSFRAHQRIPVFAFLR